MVLGCNTITREIYDHLRDTAENPTLVEVADLAKEVSHELDDIREDLVSAIEACTAAAKDEYLDKLKARANSARMVAADKFAQAAQPKGGLYI